MTVYVRAAALALALAASVCAPAVAAEATRAPAPKAPTSAPAPAAARAPVEFTMGNPNAKVKVTEYASVVCPHCARFNEEVFPAFKAKYIDTGKVLYAFREFPTEPVQVAAAGFLIARCAPGKYFPVVDALFKGQAKLFETRDARQYLTDAGRVGGLSDAQIEACLKDEAALDAFGQRVQDVFEKDNIRATPTFVVGQSKLEGEQSLAQLDAAIAPLLGDK